MGRFGLLVTLGAVCPPDPPQIGGAGEGSAGAEPSPYSHADSNNVPVLGSVL